MEAAAKRPPRTARPMVSRVAKPAARLEANTTKRVAVASRPTVKRQRAAVREDMKTSTLHLRLKDGVKEKAAATLADIGLSVPEAIRVFLGRIVSEGRLPFELEVPNALTRRAMDEADRISAARFQIAGDLFDDLEKGSGR